MSRNHSIYVVVSFLLGFLMFGVLFGLVNQSQASAMLKIEDQAVTAQRSMTETQRTIFLPFAYKYSPLRSIFGVESGSVFVDGHAIYSHTVDLPVEWARLNDRISWRALQPVEGAGINWGQLAGFEEELRLLKSAGITPIVILDDYPHWATDHTVRQDGQPTSCGKLLEDKVDDFASFVVQIVDRYRSPEFGVRNWELGNEPDVDPNLLPPDNSFGCWGDIDDPYYGGEAYGRMIGQVGRAIHAADPLAKVWIGGLLLASPNTTDTSLGRPELFFEGILRSGAGPYFDVVPYHWYPSYGWQWVRDFDLYSSLWKDWGGGTVGKARYLRQVMQAYGVSKPLFLNETSFICPYDPLYPDKYVWCENPTQDFYNLQASYIVRSATRAYNEDISGFIWYTVNGPGWRWGALLDATQSPKPVYWAYQQMINRFRNTLPLGPASFADGIEAYVFDHGAERLNVLWAIDDETITVTVPVADWISAYGRDGEIISPTLSGTDYLLPVGFTPIYLELRP